MATAVEEAQLTLSEAYGLLPSCRFYTPSEPFHPEQCFTCASLMNEVELLSEEEAKP